jgi:hypothetical protein
VNVEALYVDSPGSNWSSEGVGRPSFNLASMQLTSDNFEFLPKGAPAFGGPTEAEWQALSGHPTAYGCEDDPGGP